MGAMPIIPFVLDDIISGNELGTYKTEHSIWDAAPCDYLDYKLFMILEKHEIKEIIKKKDFLSLLFCTSFFQKKYQIFITFLCNLSIKISLKE